MSNSHLLSRQEKWIKLSITEVKHIFTYYFILFFMSFIGAGIMICFFIDIIEKQLGVLLIFSFFCGMIGSTFYYIRKLYKSCIQLLVDSKDNADSIMAVGAKVYFYFRPIMGATLAVFIILGIYGGFLILQNNPEINSEKFFIFSAIISFIIGFSNGSIIVKLDNSKDKIAEIINFAGEDKLL